jgi:hypothetical protein
MIFSEKKQQSFDSHKKQSFFWGKTFCGFSETVGGIMNQWNHEIGSLFLKI